MSEGISVVLMCEALAPDTLELFALAKLELYVSHNSFQLMGIMIKYAFYRYSPLPVIPSLPSHMPSAVCPSDCST